VTYVDLLELARREHELAAEGRFDELVAIGEEWDQLTASLPEPTPSERDLLEEIEVIVWSTVASAHKALHDVAGTLTLINRGRRAIASYAAQAPAALTAVDAHG
jgi:hypothetical protein